MLGSELTKSKSLAFVSIVNVAEVIVLFKVFFISDTVSEAFSGVFSAITEILKLNSLASSFCFLVLNFIVAFPTDEAVSVLCSLSNATIPAGSIVTS